MQRSSPRKIKVLIVDDEPDLTYMLKMNLDATGDYEVMATNEPLKAKDLAASFQPDILLLDVVMPGMDGGDVLREIRTLPGLTRVPTIMISALVSSMEVSQNEVVDTGDCVMLPKPIRLEKLLATMAQVLSGHL